MTVPRIVVVGPPIQAPLKAFLAALNAKSIAGNFVAACAVFAWVKGFSMNGEVGEPAFLQLSHHEEIVTKVIYERVRDAFRDEYGDVEVTLFGSRSTGLSTPDSDFDINVGILLKSANVELPSRDRAAMVKAELMSYAGVLRPLSAKGQVVPIPARSAPLIHLTRSSELGSLEVDITFGSYSSRSTSEITQYLCQRWPATGPLSVTLKATLSSLGFGGGSSQGLGRFPVKSSGRGMTMPLPCSEIAVRFQSNSSTRKLRRPRKRFPIDSSLLCVIAQKAANRT
ncbi:hypothetical protein A4X13_0g5967 [Tilletia indica]|uniref:Poly(A) RNA polymerase mitochondrial-like central palm domain-containing protein n=1 Tax=Tilletia indica TaxID=43049 RepID=A0A177TFU9_9BASI|nr:hypothetical protein A4X13_0g5967 [Tilletia indica]